MVAQGFRSSLKVGEQVELELADLCISYGWSVHKMTAGFGSNIPMAHTREGRIKAPDIRLDKPYHSAVALECKAKSIYNDSYIFDRHRIEYAHAWTAQTQIPLLYVLKSKPYEEPDPLSWSCCSLHKLYGNHDILDETSTDRNNNICPTYIYDSDLFFPFAEYFLDGPLITKNDVKFYTVLSGGGGEVAL
jgi:hypothetical protein